MAGLGGMQVLWLWTPGVCFISYKYKCAKTISEQAGIGKQKNGQAYEQVSTSVTSNIPVHLLLVQLYLLVIFT